jgi:hypothetical protein
MPRTAARFRVSIKDNKVGTCLKVELIESPGLWGERRYRVRVNGRAVAKVREVTLSGAFDRLRRWTVRQAGR